MLSNWSGRVPRTSTINKVILELTKAEGPSHQPYSGEVNEQCGRLGKSLELSKRERSVFTSNPDWGEYD